jgi:hypothetical protein
LALGPSDSRIGLGLVGLQAGADVFADFDVGDVDRDDLERRVGVEAAVKPSSSPRSKSSRPAGPLPFLRQDQD